jgi:hypothetical protein
MGSRSLFSRPVLFAAVPVEMVAVEIVQEGFGQCAEDEGDSGPDQGAGQKKGVPTDDPRMRELQMQQLKMTKDALPIGGCLPMLLQFPLLIAILYGYHHCARGTAGPHSCGCLTFQRQIHITSSNSFSPVQWCWQ